MGPDGPQYTMGGKVVEMYREGAPGPGQYELRVESGPGVKIGKEKEETEKLAADAEAGEAEVGGFGLNVINQLEYCKSRSK